MAPVALTSRALRFLDEASRSEQFKATGLRDDVATIRSWELSTGDWVFTSRENVVVPAEVAAALLGVVDFVSAYAGDGGQFGDWDDNDVAYIECVGESIRAAMRPRSAAAS